MLRATLTAVAGAISGAALAALLLWLTSLALAWRTAPETFRIEHGVIYVSVVLGAGFGAVAGALIGAARCSSAQEK